MATEDLVRKHLNGTSLPRGIRPDSLEALEFLAGYLHGQKIPQELAAELEEVIDQIGDTDPFTHKDPTGASHAYYLGDFARRKSKGMKSACTVTRSRRRAGGRDAYDEMSEFEDDLRTIPIYLLGEEPDDGRARDRIRSADH